MIVKLRKQKQEQDLNAGKLAETRQPVKEAKASEYARLTHIIGGGKAQARPTPDRWQKQQFKFLDRILPWWYSGACLLLTRSRILDDMERSCNGQRLSLDVGEPGEVQLQLQPLLPYLPL